MTDGADAADPAHAPREHVAGPADAPRDHVAGSASAPRDLDAAPAAAPTHDSARPATDRPWPTASTRGLAVLGWPVSHSLSPVMHNAALAHDGLDLAYLALSAPPDHLAEVVAGLGTAGFVGANVTVPHKQAVRDLCDVLTPEAELVGAVNTLTWRGGELDTVLEGHNTDAIGLGRALDEVGAGQGPAVVLGTGGAARAAVVALVRRGHPVTVVGRRPAAARDLADLATRVGADTDTADTGSGANAGTAPATALHLDDEEVADVVRGAAVVVNATPLGMEREDLPAPFMALGPDQTAYDLVYAPPDTPFVTAAEHAGANAHHGLSMLVHQAAVAYEHWTGRPAPVDVMRAAAESALAG